MQDPKILLAKLKEKENAKRTPRQPANLPPTNIRKPRLKNTSRLSAKVPPHLQIPRVDGDRLMLENAAAPHQDQEAQTNEGDKMPRGVPNKKPLDWRVLDDPDKKAKSGKRAQETPETFAKLEDDGRYERRHGKLGLFTAYYIDRNGTEHILPKEGSNEPAQDVSLNLAYRAHMAHRNGHPSKGAYLVGNRDTSVDSPRDQTDVQNSLIDGAMSEVAGPAGTNELDEAPEGMLIERKHFARHRNRKLRDRKIKEYKQANGTLRCEICEFDFAATYGPRGEGYIECHHRRPLSDSGQTNSTLDDLILICANCHRMIHWGSAWLTPDEVRDLIAQYQK